MIGAWFMTPAAAFLLALSLAVSFLFAGIEAGLLSASRVRLHNRAQGGDKDAIRLQKLLDQPERLMATVLLVTNFADIAALVLLTESFVRRWGNEGYVWAGLVLAPVYLMGVQLLPKSLFRRFPYRALAALAALLEATSRVLSPALAVGDWLGRRWFPAAGARMGRLFVAREEFKTLAAEGERVGAISATERGLIQNVVDFNALKARDFLHPASATLRASETLRMIDLLDFAAAHNGLEQAPVVDDAGKLVALADRDALLFDQDPQRSAAGALRRRPITARLNEPASRVLRRLRAARLPAAGVEDEAGRFLGVVLTRELLQRLVRDGA